MGGLIKHNSKRLRIPDKSMKRVEAFLYLESVRFSWVNPFTISMPAKLSLRIAFTFPNCI